MLIVYYWSNLFVKAINQSINQSSLFQHNEKSTKTQIIVKR